MRTATQQTNYEQRTEECLKDAGKIANDLLDLLDNLTEIAANDYRKRDVLESIIQTLNDSKLVKVEAI